MSLKTIISKSMKVDLCTVWYITQGDVSISRQNYYFNTSDNSIVKIRK